MACKHPAGETCHCNMNEPCLDKYTIWSDGPTVEYKAGGPFTPRLHLLDSGKGAQVSIAIVGSCETKPSSCPSGYIKSGTSFSESISATECKAYNLPYYDPSSKIINLWSALKVLFGQGMVDVLPSTQYLVHITQCVGRPQILEHHYLTSQPSLSHILGIIPSNTYIDVYPKVEIQPALTIELGESKRTLSDEERYEEYNKSSSADGWRGMEVPSEEIKKSISLTGSLTITQGDKKTEYSGTKTTSSGNVVGETKVVNLQDELNNIKKQMKTLSAITDMVEKIMAGTYQSAGEDKVKLIGFGWKPPKLIISGSCSTTLVNQQIATKLASNLKFDPLISFSITLDLLLAVAAYFKVAGIVEDIRQEAKRLEAQVKAGEQGIYAGAGFDITLSTSLDTNFNVSQEGDSAVKYDASAEATVGLSVAANITGGAKTWLFEGAFKLTGDIVAKAGIALRSTGTEKKPKVELIFFHKGILMKVSIAISGSLNDNGGRKNSAKGVSADALETGVTEANKATIKVHKEWVWAEELTEQASTYRKTLIG